MTITKQTLQKMKVPGMKLKEKKTYATLLSLGVATKKQLKKQLGTPPQGLDTMVDNGFAIQKPANPTEYVAIPPAEAKENYELRNDNNINIPVKQLNKAFDKGTTELDFQNEDN